MRLQPELLEKSAIMNALDAKLDGITTQVSEKKEKKAEKSGKPEKADKAEKAAKAAKPPMKRQQKKGRRK